MNLKTSMLWALLLALCVGATVGCEPASKKTPDQPSPNTTDTK